MRRAHISEAVLRNVQAMWSPQGSLLGFMVLRPGRLPAGPFHTTDEALAQACRDSVARITA